MLKKPQMILIDVDGTLVDSVPDLAFCVDEMMRRLCREPHGEAKVRDWVGNGVERLVRRALPLIDPEAREKMFFRIYGLNDRGGDESTGVISGPQQDGDCDRPPFGREDAWWKGPPGRPFPICGSEPLARGKGKH